MKLFDKYRLNKANDEERNAMTEKLIINKIDREKRKVYAEKLAAEYGIKRTPPAKSLSVWRRNRWLTGIAASLLVGVLAWQLFLPQSSNYTQLTDNYLVLKYPNNEARKGAQDILNIKAQAISAYNEQDYKKAAILRSQLIEQEEATEYDYFFLGLSYLYQQPAQAQKAIDAFQSARRSTRKELQQETEWFLALAYLKADEPDKARPLLEKQKNTGEWQVEKATALLNAIEHTD